MGSAALSVMALLPASFDQVCELLDQVKQYHKGALLAGTTFEMLVEEPMAISASLLYTPRMSILICVLRNLGTSRFQPKESDSLISMKPYMPAHLLDFCKQLMDMLDLQQTNLTSHIFPKEVAEVAGARESS